MLASIAARRLVASRVVARLGFNAMRSFSSDNITVSCYRSRNFIPTTWKSISND